MIHKIEVKSIAIDLSGIHNRVYKPYSGFWITNKLGDKVYIKSGIAAYLSPKYNNTYLPLFNYHLN